MSVEFSLNKQQNRNSRHMPYSLRFLRSPAAPAVILLYGIIFFFAIAYFIGMSWQRIYTIILYSGVLIWAAIVVIDRFKSRRPCFNRIDLLFVSFLICILISSVMNWWEGTINYLKLMPVFFLAPYLLGRVVDVSDILKVRHAILVMTIVLVLFIVPEYLRVQTYGLPHNNSPTPTIFGQSHGVMLSGLLIAAGLVTLVSMLQSAELHYLPFLSFATGRYLGYAVLVLLIVTMGWISSRSGILAGLLGVSIFLFLAPKETLIRKFEIVFFLVLGVMIAVINSLNWKANSAYYAQVLSPPALFSTTSGSGIASADNMEWRGAVLGKGACDYIVDSVSDRWVHYQQAATLFLAKPLFGAGANQYGFFACTGPGSFPHSTLLQVLAELGVIVAFVYCTMIWLTLATFVRARRQAHDMMEMSIWSWLVAFAVMQVLIAQLTGNYFLSATLYLVIGAAASVYDLENKNLKGTVGESSRNGR